MCVRVRQYCQNDLTNELKRRKVDVCECCCVLMKAVKEGLSVRSMPESSTDSAPSVGGLAEAVCCCLSVCSDPLLLGAIFVSPAAARSHIHS